MIKNKYGAHIKKCREQKGYTQQQMADFLYIARTSYIAVEQNKREITLSEANSLTSILGLSIDDILGSHLPDMPKYKDMILSFLKLNIKDGKIPKTKLAKLIYFADFAWYYENLVSMSGMQYKKLEYGPVAEVYFRALDELYESGQIDIESKNESILVSICRGAAKDSVGSLNLKEKDLIKKINTKWSNKRTKEIVDFTHSQLPWKMGRDGEFVHYELITQEDPDHVY